MDEVMNIYGTDLTVKEYKGHRVVTFKDIDAVHQRPQGTARKRFNDNRKHFVSGVDFFRVNQASEIRTLGIKRPQGGTPNEVYLITETGYLMLVKSFTDDLAWKVQRELVDSYFRAREMGQDVKITETIREENPEIYLEAARIMASVPDSQPYVINCLRHVVSDIDINVPAKLQTTEVTVSTEPKVTKKKSFYYQEGVPIDVEKLRLTMAIKHLSSRDIAEDIGVTVQSVNRWLSGSGKPILENRENLCIALGEDKDFLTPKRKRNKRVR